MQKIRNHSVIVDEGSGVLIQPASGESSYVVTAKHVIEIEEHSNVFRKADEINVVDYNGSSIEIVAVHVNEKFDMAVLITKEKLVIDLQPAISRPLRSESVLFYGYPETRRDGNPEDCLREFEGEVKESNNNRFIVTLKDIPDWGQVAGASGGGIFKIVGGDIFLCGIETRMEGDVSAEHHGRVVCLPLCALEELLVQKQLALIYPAAMNSFIGLVSKTFNYYDQADDPQNLRFLKNKLHEYAAKLSVNEVVKPLDLFCKLKGSLLINNSPMQDLYCSDLWVAYLEFIVISCLIDGAEVLDFSYIENNSTRRRFLFSAHKENWVWRLMDIFRSDFRGLRRDGVIVISTGDKTGKLEAKKQQVDSIVMDIGRADRSDLMVDAAIVNPAKEFKVYHLTGLHKVCVLDKEYDYRNYYAGSVDFDEVELITKFCGEYRAYI